MASAEISTLVESKMYVDEISFRKTLLFHLKQNAKPKTLLKLMQIAKYFCFDEFPFFVVKELAFTEQKWGYKELMDSDEEEEGYYYESFYPGDAPGKFWITESLEFEFEDYPHDFLLVLPQIVVCDVKKLNMHNQKITLKEFQFLTAGPAISVELYGTTIKNENDENVALENILKCLPSAQDFVYGFNDESALTMTSESTINVIEILKTFNLKLFVLHEIPETFNFNAFSKILGKNVDKKPRTSYRLFFNDHISAEYQQQLQAYVDEMAKDKHFISVYPLILKFPIQTKKEFKDLFDAVYFHFYQCNSK
uniref:DUF38 domain-containing protein n=1 Tax=Panagrolaimus sp. ES5 TaxID=591445 RepID=A0AC34FHL5_9BILA